ncbi:replication-associated recombination protein A [Magnetofaba australis]|uniref:Replication-associated recombination protein A n=1 Tax=Magnetofaba australis IT-1 TaxID=1434232 RepID=A0A1Y2K4R8_9PROT|nr:replication-associated recombination protein A [Magnetofaba australis]OSM04370.1 putative recombination factor protein RarA [Magnetofaba australis IT-1]
MTAEAPLADRMRPRSLEEVVGQEAVTGPGQLLALALAEGRIPSMILWGPPGCGKTTIARVLAHSADYRFEQLSAVLAGVKDVRAVVERAQNSRAEGEPTILFVDEIHRFNKAQQDAFLPFVENGDITLIGATTENPSFELNGALLSRCRVTVLQELEPDKLIVLLERALTDAERGLGLSRTQIADDALELMAEQAAGDARYALNMLETFVDLHAQPLAKGETLSREQLQNSLQRRAALYDKKGDGHYNLISALHKSLRGSDADASLYWLARMLGGGEDGLYVARRMVRFASEDIGNADPQALAIAIQARDAYHFLGPPEGDLALAQCAVYLATAPKSNSVYVAYKKAQKLAQQSGHLAPPKHILNAPTRMMKELGYGKGYKYAHDYADAFAAQECFPDALAGTVLYEPVERGFEREIAKRLQWWRKRKLEAMAQAPEPEQGDES